MVNCTYSTKIYSRIFRDSEENPSEFLDGSIGTDKIIMVVLNEINIITITLMQRDDYNYYHLYLYVFKNNIHKTYLTRFTNV